MFPSLTCWALQRSHRDIRASFSSHILQTLFRVHPRMSFALFCSTDGICASCFSLQNSAVFILCPSSCFPSLWAWDCLQIECVCFIPSARPFMKTVIRIKPRTDREESMAALVCHTLEKSTSPALTLVFEGHFAMVCLRVCTCL